MQNVSATMSKCSKVSLDSQRTGVSIASPLVEDCLADDCERDCVATLGGVEDLVAAHGHRYHLCLEAGGDHAAVRREHAQTLNYCFSLT